MGLRGAAAAALAATLACGAAAAPAPRVLLPDLVQEPPSGIVVTRSSDGPLLGFASAVSNLGAGPLTVEARRLSRSSRTMRADQILRREGARALRRRGVGHLSYARAPDHSHWHLAPFERYELRRAGDGRRVARSHKQGFCLGDRYRARKRVPAAPRAPAFTSRCGLDAPRLLRLREGISVGYGDDYPAVLEGQHVALAGLRAGRYVLVHRVNSGRRLKESDYSNNAASLLLALTWSGADARVRVLRACPGRARCDRPPEPRRGR